MMPRFLAWGRVIFPTGMGTEGDMVREHGTSLYFSTIPPAANFLVVRNREDTTQQASWPTGLPVSKGSGVAWYRKGTKWQVRF